MADAEIPPTSPTPLPSIGSYRLVQQLGSGGMSSVFHAVHTETGHDVAVKILPRYLAKNPTLLQRFLREAKSAEALEHPNIVAIYDRGSESGRYYLVLEYVAGGDLHDRVRDKGPMVVDEAIEVVKAVCLGLSHAASRGLIHRDVKPANILLQPDGKVKITDLGLALQMEQEDERVTRDGTTVGTVDYMSPEQARDSRATSLRSDIYSLGCTFYYLLTGSPPFVGGDLPDKLRRHAQEPPPDVRKLRPDVPEALSKLIRRMMAKRPEKRFESYEQLIAALDACRTGGAGQDGAGGLFALVDDEDDDSDDAIVLTVAGPAPAASPPRRDARPAADPSGQTSLAELAALAEDTSEPSSRPVRRRGPSSPELTSRALDDDFGMDEFAGGGTRRVDDTSVKDWIIRGLLAGVAIVLVGFGVQQLIAFQRSQPETPKEEVVEQEQQATAEEQGPAPAIPSRPAIKKQAEPPRPEVTVRPAWVEPTDVSPAQPAEPQFPADLEAKLAPAWLGSEAARRPDGPTVAVRRLEAPPGGGGQTSLTLALESSGGTIEIADDGPFYEHDLRLASRSRLIRARPGHRPIVVLGPSVLAHTKSLPAQFVLEGQDVTIEGIDFVIEAGPGDIPIGHASLFLCRSGTLTLRDCTVTVAGSEGQPLTLVKLEEGGPSAASRPPRLVLDRTLIRGPALTAIQLGDGRGEAVVSRSVLLSGGSSALNVTGRGTKDARKVYLLRSVVASKRAVLESSAPAGPASPTLLTLGNVFARIDGGASSAPFIARDGGAQPRDLLSWAGDFNAFQGWSGILSTQGGTDRDLKIADLVIARETWPSSQENSLETPAPWPPSLGQGWAVPADLEVMAPALLATLRRVASPSPYLWEKTLGTFARLPVPDAPPPDPRARPVSPGPTMMMGMSRPGFRPASPESAAIGRSAPGSAPPKAAAAPPKFKVQDGVQVMTFDASAPPWNGDLGRFLAEQIAPEARRVVVDVDGQGEHAMTPLRVPAGILLEISVHPQPGHEPPAWYPHPGALTEALIDAPGADLTLTGVRFRRDAASGPKHVIRVEDGRLVMTGCWLTTLGNAPTGGGSLILFRSTTSAPLDRRPPAPPTAPVHAVDYPAARLVDCLLIAGDSAITAELGRGVVSMTGCAIAAETDAITLVPAKVSRSRFLADLHLERCTLVAGRQIVRLGPDSGGGPGPARPWLVSTRGCAFLDAYNRGNAPRQMTLLRADAGTFSRGGLTWQGSGDAYEVTHFAALGNTPAAGPRKPDLVRDWVELWGRSHIGGRNFGPSRTGPANPAVRLAAERLHSGNVHPRDLALDAALARTRKTQEIGADTARLGIVAAAPPPKPARKRP